jgi:hypothetical protein
MNRMIPGLLAATWLVITAAAISSPVTEANYPSAQAAADALVHALKAHDEGELAKVFGSDWRQVIPVEGIERQDVDSFVTFYEEKHALVDTDGKKAIEVGSEGWTLPIPLAKGSDGWHFDLVAGREEMTARRIEANQWSVVGAMLAYYDAQRDYASVDRDGDKVPQYASRLVSTAGKHDGLYWQDAGGKDPSPLGEFFASPPKGQEFLGYRYRILTAQGPSAPGGAYSYMAGKRMTHGFALVAWPARYGQSGKATFIVSHDGLVFQKDLGADTGRVAAAMTSFDPDSSWAEVRTEY